MANQFITNQTPATYAFCMYNLLNTMSAAGWSIMAWSDGTTVHNTGTIPGPYQAGPGSPDPVFPLTGTFSNTGNTGANGMDNNNSWWVMRQPKGTGSVGAYAGNRMLVFQRGTNDTLWRIKYSVGPLAGISHVSQYQFASDATHTPSLFASVVQDDATICGGGSDASPTFQTLFGAGAPQRGTSRFNVMANDGLAFETSPFAIYAVAWNAGAGFPPSMAFIFEPMTAGSTAPGEIDPFVVGCSSVSPGTLNGSLFLSTSNPGCAWITGGSNNVTGAFAWYKYGQSSAAVQKLMPQIFIYWNSGLGATVSVPGSSVTGNPMSTNPVNSDDDLFPMAYGRPPAFGSGPGGYKGVGSMMKWNSAVRATGDTQAQATVRDRIILGSVSVPWDASVPTL
jgi:hypothetical protein